MSFYQKVAEIGKKFISQDKLFKMGFNLSPMYRRSTARIISASQDILKVKIKLPISYKNRNYVNSIFGGSMFSAVDPIPMVQLIHILGDEYVVWDKSAKIFFKRPAKENLYAEFLYTPEEIENIQKQLALHSEIEILKTTSLTNKDQTVIFCEVHKTIYIANKKYFKEKRRKSRFKVK
jgi:hypothetical protein